MNERLEDLFHQAIVRTHERYRLELTGRATDLIRLTLESIEVEPDARWPQEARGDLQRIQERAIERLPELLRWVSRTHGTELINTFLLLQAAPRLIDAFCIWEKP
jgi:hypothetical protein